MSTRNQIPKSPRSRKKNRPRYNQRNYNSSSSYLEQWVVLLHVNALSLEHCISIHCSSTVQRILFLTIYQNYNSDIWILWLVWGFGFGISNLIRQYFPMRIGQRIWRYRWVLSFQYRRRIWTLLVCSEWWGSRIFCPELLKTTNTYSVHNLCL